MNPAHRETTRSGADGAGRGLFRAPGTVGRVVAGVLALASLATPGAAQDRPPSHDGDDRGWIGVSLGLTADRRGRPDGVVIMDVSAGSPAERAGLRAGDHVVAINDVRRPEELVSLPELLRLRAGDRVAIEIDRDGDRQRLRLRAAPRPHDFTPSRSIEVAVRADSLVESWVRSMDSMRGELVTAENLEAVRLRRLGRTLENARATVVATEADRSVRVPFEFFVFRGEAHDSLRQEMVETNRMLAELQARIGERERELRARFGVRQGRSPSGDPELQRLRSQLERVSSRSDGLEAAMADAARATAGFDYGVVPGPSATVGFDYGVIPGASATARGDRDVVVGEFRPLTPYLLGRNRVAGAEVTDLRPELAEYFGVSKGVLVVDVAAGTPAQIAGILPGDVITRIDQVGVGTVEDLRFGVSVAGDSLPLTLIRKGASRQVLLRR